MQTPDSDSPRPSSTSSAHSFQSFASSEDYQERGPRRGQDICIGEEVKISIHLAMERFRMNESQRGKNNKKINLIIKKCIEIIHDQNSQYSFEAYQTTLQIVILLFLYHAKFC